jgi:hypothetical protein
MCYLEYSQNWNNPCVNAINEQEEDRGGWLKWETTGSNVDGDTNYVDCPSSGSKCRGADKSLARPTSRCIFLMVRIFLFMLVFIYIYSTNISPIMIINRIYEHQNLLSL